MELALRLGRRNMGNSGSNPAVGCVIIDERRSPPRIVAVGWTGRGGRPHAEQVALARAGGAARGATAYVTLEPCAHYGRTPPCARGLVEAGIGRLVTTFDDPDPRVSGRGNAMLREAGIPVTMGVRSAEARQDLAGFLSRMERGRPHVILKLAVSADGKIAERPGAQTAITGPAARAYAHMMRATSDAILVGHRTVVIDDPELTCRLPGLRDRSPIRVVLASAGLVPLQTKMLRDVSTIPVWVLAKGEPTPGAWDTLERVGVALIPCGEGGSGGVDLDRALRELSARGVGRLLVEGGAAVARALMEADLVDEVALFSASRRLGPAGVDALAGLPLASITRSDRFVASREEGFGEDRLTVYVRRYSPAS